MILHFFVRSSKNEKNICAFFKVRTGFEDCHKLATFRTEKIVNQHQNCSFAGIQTNTFRMGIQILSKLANSTLLKLCSGMAQEISKIVVSRIWLRQDHRCGHRRIVKLKQIIGLCVDCGFFVTFVNLRLDVSVCNNRIHWQRGWNCRCVVHRIRHRN